MTGRSSSSRGAGIRKQPGRTRLEADDRREQIVLAARALFAQRPYESVSTGEIAAAAGTTRTNIHYYFSTKRDLFLAVIERFTQIPPAEHSAPAGPVEDVVRVTLARWLDTVERNAEIFMTMLHASSSQDPQVSGALRTSMHAWESRLAILIGMDPALPRNSASLRSYQAMVAAATAEWLESDNLTKAEVLSLLCEGLFGVRRALAQTS